MSRRIGFALLLVLIVSCGVFAEVVIVDDFADPAKSQEMWSTYRINSQNEREALKPGEIVFEKGRVRIQHSKPAEDPTRSWPLLSLDRTFQNFEIEYRYSLQRTPPGDTHTGILLIPIAQNDEAPGRKVIVIRPPAVQFVDSDISVNALKTYSHMSFAGEFYTLKAIMKQGTLTIYIEETEVGTFEDLGYEYEIRFYVNNTEVTIDYIKITEL